MSASRSSVPHDATAGDGGGDSKKAASGKAPPASSPQPTPLKRFSRPSSAKSVMSDPKRASLLVAAGAVDKAFEELSKQIDKEKK